MKQTVSVSDFRDAFLIRQDNFTYDGLGALYDWLIQLEEDSGTEEELDVIALCCDFSEYKDLAEFQGDYNAEDYTSIEDIENETMVIRVGDKGFIIQGF